MMKLICLFLQLLALTPSFAQESTFVSPNQAVGTGTILSKIENSAFFSALSQYPEYMEMLEGEGPWTVIVPSDAAIAALPEMGEDELKNLVLFHVMEGFMFGLDVTSFATNKYTMKNGEVLQSYRLPASFVPAVDAERSNLLVQDIFAVNGVVHQVDAVLEPPSASSGNGDEAAGATQENSSSGFSLVFASMATAFSGLLLLS